MRASNTWLHLPCTAQGGPGFRAEVTRAEFEALTAPLRARLWPPLEAIGRQAFVEWAGRCAQTRL